MPTRSKNSEYYAVIRGYYITVPTVFSSRGDVHPLVSSFSNPIFHVFKILSEAEDYMDIKGVKFYECNLKHGAGATNPIKNNQAYYAVANGRTPGIQSYYNGCGGTEPEVAKFSGACHKHFRTESQARAFESDWIEMFACVAKDNIKKALLDGHRPTPGQEWSLSFEWKKDPDEIEDELTDNMTSMRLDRSEQS